MKRIVDKELKIKVINKMASYDLTNDRFSYNKVSPTRFKQYGYLMFDEKNRNVGIVFMSDDKRRPSYGYAEILFFKDYEQEFDNWRQIKIDKIRLPYDCLESCLLNNGEYNNIIDSRSRNCK
jgi:hypothetical protein